MKTPEDEAFDEIAKRQGGFQAKRKMAADKQEQKQEPVRKMPSNTRYTVAVEGQALSYWDNVHDAITNAQRAVYSGPTNTTRALDDLKAGRIAEWSYGFSAVRIYPPQSTTQPQRQPEQEPVAYAVYHRMGGSKSLHWPEQHSDNGDHNKYQLVPLYTSPPQRQPLTDEAIATVYWGVTGQSLRPQDNVLAHNFARAIEAAHGIKGES